MLRLLVVDDEVDVCDFVKNFFKERNFEVLVAYNGQEALEVVNDKHPEIILLDLRMPVMDGMDTLKEIHKKSENAKVIVITAVEDTQVAEEAKKHGAIDYITKPLLLEQLERTVLILAEQIKMDSQT